MRGLSGSTVLSLTNLNDGDAIYLLVKNTKPVADTVNFSSVTRYAISLQ